MDRRQPIPAAERRRLQRWIAAVGLLSAAEDRRSADVPETNAMALLSAHAACEAMLGLVIGIRPDSQNPAKADPPFGQMLKEAQAVSKIPSDLAGDLETMHRTRNGFVHAGQTVDALEVGRATEAAHRLAEHVPAPGEGRIAGVATVVADIIDIEAIGMWLRHVDEMRVGGRLRLAADDLARALDSALERTVPPVRRTVGISSTRRSQEVRASVRSGTLAQDVSDTFRAIDSLTRWVFPLAIGVSPATYSEVRAVIGSGTNEDVGGRPWRIQRPTQDPPSEDELRWAVNIVAETIFRLWAMGSLAAAGEDDAIVELAQEFLANPSGIAAGEPRQERSSDS